MNEFRMVRPGADCPEVCIHNVLLGPKTNCPECPSTLTLSSQMREIYALLDQVAKQVEALYVRMYKMENAIEDIRNLQTKA